MYPPLVCSAFHGGLSVDFFIISLHLSGLSSLAGAINVVCTIMYCRRAYSLLSCSLMVWAFFSVAMLILLVVPVLAGAISLVLLDRSLNTVFFDVSAGGDVVLYQHLFWVFGHPEVYIIILPVFGLVSHVLSSSWGCGSLFNVIGMIFAIVCISLVGFFVWAHHMFTVGIDVDARTYFSSVSLLIALPTSIKVFSWLVTLTRSMVSTVPLWLVYGFMIMFFLGGCTGLVLANCDIDMFMHDSYFVVGHFHFVLSLGAVYGFLCGQCLVYQMSLGLGLLCGLGRLVVMLVVFGSNSVFWPLHGCGLLGFTRRTLDFADQFLGVAGLVSGGLSLVYVSLCGLAVVKFGLGCSVGAVKCGCRCLPLGVLVVRVHAMSSLLDLLVLYCNVHVSCSECCCSAVLLSV